MEHRIGQPRDNCPACAKQLRDARTPATHRVIPMQLIHESPPHIFVVIGPIEAHVIYIAQDPGVAGSLDCR